MIPLDEFYSYSERKQCELVDGGHVVIGKSLAEKIPSQSRNDVCVFEKPIVEQIVQVLRQGQYKISEIALELPLDRKLLKDVVYELRYNRIGTLANYKGVVRAAGRDGPANVYTFDSLPFQVRTIDPTLSNHLLLASQTSLKHTLSIQEVSSSSGYSEYTDRVGEYWGLPESELRTNLDQESRFVSSALGPLPLPEKFPEASSIRDRILDVDSAYVRKKYTPRKVHHAISFRKSRTRRNSSLPAFQEFANYLADVHRYARLKNNRALRELVRQGAEVYFRCLYGDYRSGDSIDWQPFEVRAISGGLTESDRRILDILQLQPTKNSELAEKWKFNDSGRVFRYLRDEFSQFATRNEDQFICATESARRRGEELIKAGKVDATKCPPAVPAPAKTPIKKPDTKASSNQRQSRRTSSGSREAGRDRDNSTSNVAETCQRDSSEDEIRQLTHSERKESTALSGDPNDETTPLNLLMDLIELANELGRPPLKADIELRSDHEIDDYEREFGSLEQALDGVNISE